jgi:hypothetical protein
MKKGRGLLLTALLLTAGPVRAQFFPGSTADEWRGPWPPPLPNMPGRPGQLLGRSGSAGGPNSVLGGGGTALWAPAPGPLSGVPGGPAGAAPQVRPEVLQMLQDASAKLRPPAVPPVQPPAPPPPAWPPLAAAPQGPPREFRGGYALVVAGACVAAALLYALLRRKPAA